MQKLSIHADGGVVHQDIAASMLLGYGSPQLCHGRRIRQIAGKSRGKATSLDDPIADSMQLVGATGDNNYVRSH